MTQSKIIVDAAARVADLCMQIVTDPETMFVNHSLTCHALADWFSNQVYGGDSRQVSQIRTAKKASPIALATHERLPPSPRAAAARLCTVMLDDIYRRLDADTAPDLVLPDLDAVRVMVTHHGLHSDVVEEMNALYLKCEPVPEPVFSAWHRQYRPDHTKPWELVASYDNHADAYRGLQRARATCPGEHRLTGVLAG